MDAKAQALLLVVSGDASKMDLGHGLRAANFRILGVSKF
jgi:hypothetical protein